MLIYFIYKTIFLNNICETNSCANYINNSNAIYSLRRTGLFIARIIIIYHPVRDTLHCTAYGHCKHT